MLKWTLRIGGGFLAVIVVALIVLLIAYSRWITNYKRELESGSQIASTALGEIEYAVSGEGTPLLRIHGRPGGYDQTIAGPRARPKDYAGFYVIAVSRPGYLRTPLSSGETPAQQADLYAALLDKLEIKRVIVYGASGGGPSALQFAVRHPDLTKGLILVVPDLQQSTGEVERENSPGPIMFLQDFGFWIGGQLLVKPLGPLMMPNLDRDDPAAIPRMKEVATSFLASDLRVAGNANDVNQYRKLDIQNWPLEKLSAPTLIVHGNADKNAPYEGSVNAAARIPGARLVTIEGGDHLILISRAREIGEHVRRFVIALNPE